MFFRERDLYEVLGVSRDADSNQIKSAYRASAKKMHPDKNPNDPHAASKFQELGAAYEILSDEKKRQRYNECGMECVKKEGKYLINLLNLYVRIDGWDFVWSIKLTIHFVW